MILCLRKFDLTMEILPDLVWELCELAASVSFRILVFRIIPENATFSMQIFKLALKIEAISKGCFFLDDKLG